MNEHRYSKKGTLRSALDCSTTNIHTLHWVISNRALEARRDRIVVSTLRCGRNNPGSNPGHGILLTEF